MLILASERKFYCLRVIYLLTTKLLFLYMEAKMFCMEYLFPPSPSFIPMVFLNETIP